MLYVKKANLEDIEKEWAFVRDMPEDENGLTNAWAGISHDDFENKALPDMLRFSRGENLPAGHALVHQRDRAEGGAGLLLFINGLRALRGGPHGRFFAAHRRFLS